MRDLEVKAAIPLIALATLFFAVTMFTNARSDVWGFDFHGVWQAGKDFLAGQSLYLEADPAKLLVPGNSFISPPPLALVAIPFSLLPFGLALLLWNLLGASALALALRVVGLRDWRCYALCFMSFPVASSVILGQPDGLLALGCALAWRYRDRRVVVAFSLAAVIAVKLIAWPLLIWLVATRRTRTALLAAATAAALVLASWAVIGFKGLTAYPSLLSADADAFQTRTHSLVAAAMGVGAGSTPARALALAVGVALIAIAVRVARLEDGDPRSFAAALGAGLLMSPVLHSHYLVLLFVPLAITRRRASGAWLLLVGLWVDPVEPSASVWRLLFTVGVALLLAAISVRRDQSVETSAILAG